MRFEFIKVRSFSDKSHYIYELRRHYPPGLIAYFGIAVQANVIIDDRITTLVDDFIYFFLYGQELLLGEQAFEYAVIDTDAMLLQEFGDLVPAPVCPDVIYYDIEFLSLVHSAKDVYGMFFVKVMLFL